MFEIPKFYSYFTLFDKDRTDVPVSRFKKKKIRRVSYNYRRIAMTTRLSEHMSIQRSQKNEPGHQCMCGGLGSSNS